MTREDKILFLFEFWLDIQLELCRTKKSKRARKCAKK